MVFFEADVKVVVSEYGPKIGSRDPIHCLISRASTTLGLSLHLIAFLSSIDPYSTSFGTPSKSSF